MNARFPLLWALLGLCACKKGDDVPRSTVSASRNGTPYALTTMQVENTDSSFTVNNTHGDNTGYSWEYLNLIGLKKTLSRQYISKIGTGLPTALCGTVWEHGDAGCDDYYTLPGDTANNYVVIQEQRNNFSEVTGTFRLRFYRAATCEISQQPSDILLFTDGQFHIYLK